MDIKLNPEKKGGIVVGVLFCVMLLVFMFPLYSIANRVEPFVMGLPFCLFWIVAWIVVEVIVLVIAYMWEYRKEVH